MSGGNCYLVRMIRSAAFSKHTDVSTRVISLVAAIVLIALAARVDVAVPGSPVPQSLQTLAVVVVGGWLGALWGGVATFLYVVVGVLGLPVFADGAAGAEVLRGPTAGYLVGFVLGAVFMGVASARAPSSSTPGVGPRPLVRRLVVLFGGAVAAHLIILTSGWFRLATILGAAAAWAAGVTPFLWGGVAKSILALPLITMLERFASLGTDERGPEDGVPVHDGHD